MDSAVQPKRSRLMRLIVIVSVVVVGAVATTQIPWVQIEYHRWRMQRNWDATYAQPDTTVGGPVGFQLGDENDAYEYHRGKLVQLGAVIELRHTFQHIQVESLEFRQFSKVLLSDVRPPCIDLSVPYDNPPAATTMTVWCYPDHAKAWNNFIESRDVADYLTRFADPQAQNKAKEYVKAWPKSGMWLPNSEQVDFFESNFLDCGPILEQALSDKNDKVRRNAAYVVAMVGPHANTLAAGLVNALKKEQESLVKIYLINALRDTESNSPEALEAITSIYQAESNKPDAIDEKIHAAAALWVLSNDAPLKTKAEDFVCNWLQPVPADLPSGKHEQFYDRQLSTVMAVRHMKGAKRPLPLLRAMLASNAQPWMSVHVPRAIEALSE